MSGNLPAIGADRIKVVRYKLDVMLDSGIRLDSTRGRVQHSAFSAAFHPESDSLFIAPDAEAYNWRDLRLSIHSRPELRVAGVKEPTWDYWHNDVGPNTMDPHMGFTLFPAGTSPVNFTYFPEAVIHRHDIQKLMRTEGYVLNIEPYLLPKK